VRDVANPTIKALHSVAEELRTKLDRYEEAVQAHQEAQSRPPAIVAEMDGLYANYTRALFEENAHGAAVVQKQRRTAQKQLERAQKDEQRAHKAHNEATETLASIGPFLGFRDRPSGGLLDAVLAELQKARYAVDEQVTRAPVLRDEEQRLQVTERVHPGTIAEHHRQKRRNQAAFEPILARF
jgi:hypothetical protein